MKEAGLEMIPIARPMIGEEEKAAVLEVLESGMLAEGPRVKALEEAFAQLVGVAHAVATSSGTTGLHLALLANGIGPGDEVITSPFTFVASANTILFTGAKPVFADVELSSYNLDPQRVEEAITASTRAIMPVHLFGQTCDMEAIGEIAQRHGLAIVEDAAQAVGADYRGRQAGSFGTGVFSLYATKNVMSAEGGMITTDDPEVADRARLLRSHGMRNRYQYETLGYNFRLTDLAAAIGLVQLRRLPATNQRRQRNAERLSAGLRSVTIPLRAPDRSHVWHQYTIRVGPDHDRDAVREELATLGVGTGVFYPRGVHEFEHVRRVAGKGSFPNAERLAREVLSLPVHPLVEEGDLDRIIDAVNSVC